MKYTDIDMQEIPRQMSPLTQVQNNSNGIQDRSNWRNRHSNSSNNNGAKECPEVIELDSEDSPIKENVEATLAANGVTTTVKKVSLPWDDRKTLGDVDKTLIESENPEKVGNENVPSKEMSLSAPVETEEALSSKITEGKRKRPNLRPIEDDSSKRLKSDVATEETSANTVIVTCQVNGLVKQDAKEDCDVSVVDLVEEEDELGEDEKKTLLQKENRAISDKKNKVQVCNETTPVISKNEAVECLSSPSPLLPVITSSAVVNVTTPASSSSEETRTKPISSVIGVGTNGILSQMQSIEVKKVKLLPRLEKQATAMSAASSLVVPTTVAMSKPAAAPALVQTQVSTSTASPESAPVPPSTITQKPPSPESAKELLKECESSISGSDLENKVGLNPAHSLTRKLVRKLTRAELESFLLEMTCDLVFSKSDAGKYRQMYEEMKEISENKTMKIAQLAKQVADLNNIVNRLINDRKDKRDAMPPRLTRSVGLQLDPNNILNTQRVRVRREKITIISPSANYSARNTSPSAADHTQPQKWNRSATSSTSKTMPPPTPSGAVTSPVAKDASPSPSVNNRSPQRQLRALHPRIPQASSQSNILSTTSPSPAQPMSASESSNKSQGVSVGVRRHRLPAVLVNNSPSNNGSTNVTLNSLSHNQVVAPSLKVAPQHYSQSGNMYIQPGGSTRVVTPTTISAGTAVAGPRLTYLFPSSNTVPVHQQQLLLAPATPQIRGRAPVNQTTSLQPMLLRPNTLVKVSSGTISTPSTTVIRTLPTNSVQMLTPGKSQQQQHPSRPVTMQNRQPATSTRVVPPQHPAPLPAQPQPTVVNPNLKPIPRRPVLKLSKVSNGIVLSWNMTQTTPHEDIASYQLYAYQEGANSPPSPSLWKKVGDVKALPLPMACTLTQFADGHTYHFAVRAVDVHGRVGEFSVPGTIALFN